MITPSSTNALLISALLSTAWAMPVLAQGTVLFRNDDRGLVYQWASETNPVPVIMGYDHEPHIQIAYAPSGTPYSAWRWRALQYNGVERWLSENAGWTLGPTANLVGMGKFEGGTISLAGVPPGAAADYVIFAWGVGDDFNYAGTLGIWCGFAGGFTTATGGGGQPAVSLADSFSGVTVIGNVLYIPEPSTLVFVLVAWGMATAFRTRNSVRKKGASLEFMQSG